jgi:hypothetical protein
VDNHGPLAHEPGVRQQDRVPAEDVTVPGRKGPDGAAEDARCECGGGEQDSAAVEMKGDANAVCRNGE